MLFVPVTVAALGLFGGAKPAKKAAKKAAPVSSEFAYGLPGVTPFPGEFDPLGLSAKATKDQVYSWREAEITHGRVGMLAALGFLVQENFHPLFDGKITGPAIEHIPQLPTTFWWILISAIGVCESYRAQYGWEDTLSTKSTDDTFRLRDDYTPGDLKFDPLGLKPDDPEEFAALQLKELNNGRLAMIAAAGFLAQEAVDHKTIFGHFA